MIYKELLYTHDDYEVPLAELIWQHRKQTHVSLAVDFGTNFSDLNLALLTRGLKVPPYFHFGYKREETALIAICRLKHSRFCPERFYTMSGEGDEIPEEPNLGYQSWAMKTSSAFLFRLYVKKNFIRHGVIGGAGEVSHFRELSFNPMTKDQLDSDLRIQLEMQCTKPQIEL